MRGPQRGPGENQTALAMEPILDKAARQLKIDRVAIRENTLAVLGTRQVAGHGGYPGFSWVVSLPPGLLGAR